VSPAQGRPELRPRENRAQRPLTCADALTTSTIRFLAVEGRIWFPGNPWPDGHAVEDFDWSGRIHPDGTLWFELSLRSEEYGAREPAFDGDGERDWRSPVVWNNYHRCTLSPGWRRGLPAAEPGRPFRMAAPQTLTADPVEEVDFEEEPAFFVYLLGHDATAGHEVTFTPTAAGHEVTWTGALALYYAGEEEFRYGFRAELRGVRFAGIAVPEELDRDAAQRMLAELVDEPERFVLDPTGRWFTPVPPRPHSRLSGA
jgi:hypothetical protein